jgi:Transmembrane secretion effector
VTGLPPGARVQRHRRRGANFWLYWVGQTASNLGRAFSAFAFPLIIYRLGGGPTGLALMTVAMFLPNLLFGLFIGAWCDRVDRKFLMISTDLLRFGALALVGSLGLGGGLHAWMLYACGFATATLDLAFESAEFAVVPALVTDEAKFVKANARMMMGIQIGSLAGPVLAGALVAVAPVSTALLFDAGSYLVSALTLALVWESFNSLDEPAQRTSTIVQDAWEGLRYVMRNRTLRNISLIASLTHLFGSPAMAQLVLFASVHLRASPTQISLLYGAEGVGAFVLAGAASLSARKLGAGGSMLTAIGLRGLLLAAMALTPSFWVVLPLWAFASGMPFFFSIHSSSLRQAIVPDRMLGRVSAIAGLLAWSVIPVSVLIGGWFLTRIRVEALYFGMGVLTLLIPVVFVLSGGVIRESGRSGRRAAEPLAGRTAEAAAEAR